MSVIVLRLGLIEKQSVRFHGGTTSLAEGDMVCTVDNLFQTRGFIEYKGAVVVLIGTMHISDAAMHLEEMWGEGIELSAFLSFLRVWC
jgi:hypothetical protein